MSLRAQRNNALTSVVVQPVRETLPDLSYLSIKDTQTPFEAERRAARDDVFESDDLGSLIQSFLQTRGSDGSSICNDVAAWCTIRRGQCTYADWKKACAVLGITERILRKIMPKSRTKWRDAFRLTCAPLTDATIAFAVKLTLALNSEGKKPHPVQGPIAEWDVSRVSNMANLFNGYDDFNADLNKWNVSNVLNMTDMFHGCAQFNSNLINWDVRKVRSMEYMFNNCFNFEGIGLQEWVTSSLTNLHGTFRVCFEFNADLSNWNVSGVEDMSHAFEFCQNFEGDLSRWRPRSCTTFSHTFRQAENFNSKLPWCEEDRSVLSVCTDMESMFQSCHQFRGYGLSTWNTKNVTNFKNMFNDAIVFAAYISEWNVSNGSNFERVFYEATSFSHDLSKWVVNLNEVDDTLFAGGEGAEDRKAAGVFLRHKN